MNGTTRHTGAQSRLFRRHQLRLRVAAAMVLAVGASMELFPPSEGQEIVVRAVGWVMVAAGVALFLYRRGTRLDPLRQEAVQFWGLVLPWRSERAPLGSFVEVTLDREVRGHGRSSRVVYPVRLAAESGAWTVDEPRRYRTARRTAEAAASIAGLDMVDATTDPPQRRRPDELDLTLAARLRAAGDGEGVPPAGSPGRLVLASSAPDLEVRLPPSGFTGGLPRLLIMAVAMLAIAGVPVFSFVAGSGVPESRLWALATVWAGAVLAVILAVLLRARAPRTVRMSWGGDLVREVHLPGPTLRRRIPADELEELTSNDAPRAAGGGPHLVARSDRTTLRFAHGLNPDELAWLLATLLRHAAHRSG